MMAEVLEFKAWELVEFAWGFGVRHRNGEWSTLVLKGCGQEIDVSGKGVILHDNGIEFFPQKHEEARR